jgi:hypothetical protein
MDGKLYLADDGTWLITKAMTGKTFAKLRYEKKLDLMGEAKAIETAVNTIIKAQELLSETTQYIQGDGNQGNVSAQCSAFVIKQR